MYRLPLLAPVLVVSLLVTTPARAGALGISADGRFFTIDEWPELSRTLNSLEPRTRLFHQSPHKLVADSRWPLLILLAGLLILEWIIHRRSGLT